MNKEKKEMEYEDAPCGFVTLYNYKEPFMPFSGYDNEKGYGFEGALVFDGKSDKIQCHLCGNWFDYLPNHLKREHGMGAEKYREIVGLNKKTALINEKIRTRMISSGLSRFKNLRPNKQHTEETKIKISKTLKKLTRETQNVVGTCPAQLLERLRQKHDELGRTPTKKEITFYGTLLKVYGSMKEACRLAGIPTRSSGINIKHHREKYTEEYFVQLFRNFYIQNGRLPKHKDMKHSEYEALRKKFNVKKIIRESLMGDGKYRKYVKATKYTQEQLKSFLLNFVEVNHRLPSYSDCKRGLLPSLSNYSRHFGSWKCALEQTFIE